MSTESETYRKMSIDARIQQLDEAANIIECPECGCAVPITEDQIFADPPTEIVNCPECEEPITILDPNWKKVDA